jgi:hypothetical protein
MYDFVNWNNRLNKCQCQCQCQCPLFKMTDHVSHQYKKNNKWICCVEKILWRFTQQRGHIVIRKTYVTITSILRTTIQFGSSDWQCLHRNHNINFSIPKRNSGCNEILYNFWKWTTPITFTGVSVTHINLTPPRSSVTWVIKAVMASNEPNSYRLKETVLSWTLTQPGTWNQSSFSFFTEASI